MISSRLLDYLFRTALFLFLSVMFIIISLGFLSLTFYFTLNLYFTPIISSLIVAASALVISILILVVIKNGQSSSKSQSNLMYGVMNFVESYPRTSILAAIAVSFLVLGKRTFYYVFRVLFRYVIKSAL